MKLPKKSLNEIDVLTMDFLYSLAIESIHAFVFYIADYDQLLMDLKDHSSERYYLIEVVYYSNFLALFS